jgi:hypothetical protein
MLIFPALFARGLTSKIGIKLIFLKRPLQKSIGYNNNGLFIFENNSILKREYFCSKCLNFLKHTMCDIQSLTRITLMQLIIIIHSIFNYLSIFGIRYVLNL